MIATELQIVSDKQWIKWQWHQLLPQNSRKSYLNLPYPETWQGIPFGMRDLDFQLDIPATVKEVLWWHTSFSVLGEEPVWQALDT